MRAKLKIGMAAFDVRAFTEKIFGVYQKLLRHKLNEVNFVLDEHNAFSNSGGARALRVVHQEETPFVDHQLDPYMKFDGGIDEDILIGPFANTLGNAVVDVVRSELNRERNNSVEHIDSGRLVLIHRMIDPPLSEMTKTYFAKDPEMGILGQNWYDVGRLKNMFMVRAKWMLVRLGEVSEEPVDVD